MIYLILSIVSSASMTLVLKLFRDQKGNRFGILLGNYLTCVLIALLSIPRKSLLWTGSGTTLAIGVLGGVFFVAALVAMQTSVRFNGATLTAAFGKLGLVVSLLVSVFWFGERPGVMQLIGICTVLCALIVMHTGRKEERAAKTSLGLLLLTLLTGGCGDSMAKVFDQFGDASENVLYIFWVFHILRSDKPACAVGNAAHREEDHSERICRRNRCGYSKLLFLLSSAGRPEPSSSRAGFSDFQYRHDSARFPVQRPVFPGAPDPPAADRHRSDSGGPGIPEFSITQLHRMNKYPSS